MMLSELFVPYFRYELPGWGRLLFLLRINDLKWYDSWCSAPVKTITGKFHHYTMSLELKNWSERLTYFLGRFYELELQLFMMASLKPGDRMLDIGGNIGMMTLLGSHLVGKDGVIDCFEPNPKCLQRISEALAQNHITNVRIHGVGLSDQEGQLTLNVVTNHSGMGTLASVPEEDKPLISESFVVPVKIGDRCVVSDSRPVRFIKIDVEGFEVHVLNGLKDTLTKDHPIVTTEMVESHLNRAGASTRQITELMTSFGYRPFGLALKKSGFKHSLKLVPLENGTSGMDEPMPNWVWIHQADSFNPGTYF